MSESTSCRLLRIQSVISQTGLSRSTIDRRIAAGLFPKPVQLGVRSVAWRAAEVDAWVKALTEKAVK